MDFRPEVGEKIIIDLPYVFLAHPAAPSFPYGQSGRRGTVYQVRLETDQTFHAIKVFTDSFRDPRNANTVSRLIHYSTLPGLRACRRRTVIPNRYLNLLQKYPQLEYAVLMPWIEGETWFDLISGLIPISTDQSFAIGRSFLQCLTAMETHQLAHCDLSGANLLVQLDQRKTSLVDVEEMYGPDMEMLDFKKRPAGTPGYAHQTAINGLWSSEADRFAGAILIAEILGWSNEHIRQSAFEAQYFNQDEIQTSCERYQILCKELRREWGDQIANAFVTAWSSKNILDCPSFSDWSSLLDTIATEPFFHQPVVEETPKPDLQEVGSSTSYPLSVEDVIHTPTYKVLDLGHIESSIKPVTPNSQTSQWQALVKRFNLQPRIILIILGVLGLLVVSFSAGGWLLANRSSTPNPNLSYVIGHVEDSSSKSLDNVSVTITVTLVNSGESETQSKRTNNEGNFQIGFNLEGEATAEISISGYGYQFTPTNRNVNLSHSNIRPFGNFQMIK